MILQTNKNLPKIIQKYGCGLMCVIWHSARLGACEISGVADIIKIYNRAIELGAMRANCYIEDWEGVFQAAGLDVAYTGRHETYSRTCADNEIEILRFPGHFIAGNGKGIRTYDSLGMSAAGLKPMKTKRIFRVNGRA